MGAAFKNFLNICALGVVIAGLAAIYGFAVAQWAALTATGG